MTGCVRAGPLLCPLILQATLPGGSWTLSFWSSVCLRWPIMHETTTDGRTVWVNGPVGLIGRFSKFGIDVHSADSAGCLHCKPGPCGRQEWGEFVASMWEHHRVLVYNSVMPDYLRSVE